MMRIKKNIAIATIAIIFASCGSKNEEVKQLELKKDSLASNHSNCENYYKEAKRLDSLLMKASKVDKQQGEAAINAFNLYASECKVDTLAPVFLVKAGQVAQSIGNFTQSQILYKKCAEEFPAFKNRGATLFLQARLFDDATMLNNESEAKNIYNQIIKEYPNSAWERDAKASLANLGKTDEQLVQEFLNKNK